MELLKDADKKVLQDYQRRLNQLSEVQQSPMNEKEMQQTKYKYSSILENNGKPSYYQQQYQQEYEHLQKENRSNSVKLTNGLPQMMHEQNQLNNQRKLPLDGLSPNEYINRKIKNQIDARKDYYSQEHSFSQSFERANSKDKKQYIQQGRFQIPSVNIFTNNFEGNLPKNADLMNKSSQDLYSQEQNDYDTHLRSLNISHKLNSLIQRGQLAEKKREEKTQLFENIIQSNAPLQQQDILKLLEQVEDNNNNQKSLYNQTNFNDRDHQIVNGLKAGSITNNQGKLLTNHNEAEEHSDLDYQPVKIQSKQTIKDKESVKSSSKLKTTQSKSKLGSKDEKLKSKGSKKGTLSTIKESDISALSSVNKDAIKKKQSMATISSKILKEPSTTSNPKNKNAISQKLIQSQNKQQDLTTQNQSETNFDNLQNAQLKPQKTEAQIIQESEGFSAVVKSEIASHNNQAMEFLKQQMIKNEQFRDDALSFIKSYISSK